MALRDKYPITLYNTLINKKEEFEPIHEDHGGMDLVFPYHECEIAQSVGAKATEPVKYWLHSN